jgi:hypothetical protein
MFKCECLKQWWVLFENKKVSNMRTLFSMRMWWEVVWDWEGLYLWESSLNEKGFYMRKWVN